MTTIETRKTLSAEGRRVELVLFEVGDYPCAIKCSDVQEIIRGQAPTIVRLAPPSVLGVINLRGGIVTVVDMRRKLRLDGTPAGNDARIIIVKSQDDERVGLLVDSVDDILMVEAGDLEASPPNLVGGLARHAKGILKTERALVSVLDVASLLNGDE